MFYTDGEPEKSFDIQKAIVRALGSPGQRDTVMQFMESTFEAAKYQTFLHMIARVGLSTICSLILDYTPAQSTYVHFSIG